MTFKKSGSRQFYLFFSSLFIFILHIPFVFAKTNAVNELKPASTGIETYLHADSVHNIVKEKTSNTITSLYDDMHLDLMGLSQQTFDYAIKGFNYLVQTGKLVNNTLISIVDFSLPSSKKRLFVIDLDQHKVVFCTYVAHGVNSGKEFANQFSNRPESYQSSLGFYETLNTYMGDNGYSLRLEGLESGINDNAGSRAIVIHGAAYVNEGLIRSQGYIGRSWGCPALPQKLHKPIINKIKNGTCLFIYSPDKNYLNKSKILNAAA